MAVVRQLVAALLLLLATCGESTRLSGTVTIGGPSLEDRFLYLGKFGFGRGRGSWKALTRLKANRGKTQPSARIQLIMDDQWPKVRNMPKCTWGMSDEYSRDLPLDKEEWHSAEGTIIEVGRPQIWYFVLTSCHQEEEVEIEYEMVILQSDGSELSVEMRYLPTTVSLAVLFLSIFLFQFYRRCEQFRQSNGSLPLVIIVLAASMVLQWTAQMLHLFHQHFYESYGITESLAEACADVVFMLSQVVSSTLLLAIARGYTLVEAVDTKGSAVMAAVIAALHVALVGHAKAQDEHPDAHHGLEGFAGMGIVTLRVVLFVAFFLRVRALETRLQPFLHDFQVAGSLYLLSFPAIYLLAALFTPFLRFAIIHLGQVCFQTASAVWLADLFFTRGIYFLSPGGATSFMISKQD